MPISPEQSVCASTCPLCGSQHISEIDRDRHREYFKCQHCSLVFVPRRFHLSQAEEKAIYDFHENDAEDEGYRNFLKRLAMPLMTHLPPDARGIDIGCGPGPTLSLMLQENGFPCAVYDPYYFPEKSLLDQQYDFVTATEVVEHFCKPDTGFQQLFALLKPGGCLGIMTKTIPELQRFSSWHYTRDLTHVSFFASTTLEYIAQRYRSGLEILRSDVALFHLPASQ